MMIMMRFLSKLFSKQSELKLILFALFVLIVMTLLTLYARAIKIQPMIQRDLHRLQASQNMPVRQLTNNPSLQKFLSQHPVYLVMTSIPSRIDRVPDILNIIDKTFIHEIIVSLPYTLKRTGQAYHIPTSLPNIEKVRILRTNEDYGPITKLLPALLEIHKTQKNAIVIVIDDDHFYPKGLVQEFIYAFWKSDQKTAFSGGVGQFGDHTQPPLLYEVDLDTLHDVWPDDNPQLLHGAYAMGLFSHHVDTQWIQMALKYEQNLGKNDCFLSDDLIISTALRQKGILFSTLKTDFFKRSSILPMEQNYWSNSLYNLPLSDQRIHTPSGLTCQIRLNQCLKTLSTLQRDHRPSHQT